MLPMMVLQSNRSSIYNFISWAFLLPTAFGAAIFRSTRAQLEPPCFPAIMTCAVKSRRKGGFKPADVVNKFENVYFE